MAGPEILAGVGIASSAAGGLLGAFGAERSAESQAKMFQYQAGISQVNRQIALQNRDYAYATGEQEAGRYGIAARQELGGLRASRSASGFDVGSGTNVDLEAGQQAKSRLDLATIRGNAARAAYGFETEAFKDDLQSGLYGMSAADAKAGGKYTAMASLLSGASSVSSKWLQAKQTGIYGNQVDVGSATGVG